MRRNQQTSTPDYAHAGKVSKTQFFVSRSSFLVSEHFELTAKQEPACVLFRDFPPPRQERATKGGQPLRWSGARFCAAPARDIDLEDERAAAALGRLLHLPQSPHHSVEH